MKTEQDSFRKGNHVVRRCSLRNHLKCVYITGREVFKDGVEGKATRHWWRMSYIGRACVAEYGKPLGTLYEAIFALPHYGSMALGNGLGYLMYWINKWRGARP